MKQQIRQIQINSRKSISFRLALSFFALISFHVTALPQIPNAESEIRTAANIEVKVSLPNIVTNDGLTNLPAAPESIAALAPEKLIHSGDTLDIDVLGSLEYDWRGKIDDEGFISNLSFLDISISALCRTEDELTREITDAYSNLIRNPLIVVRVIDRLERQPALLFGAVGLPQRFQIQRSVQLNELIIMSGGITDRASGEVNIFRPAHASCAEHKQNQVESQFINIKLTDLLSGKTEANPLVRPGDIITVEEAAPIYVTGGVVAPQRILFRQGTSVSRIIASTGGLSRNVNPNKVVVYRRQKDRSELKIIEIDFEKIINRHAEDVLLQAYDIVEIAQAGRTRNARSPVITELETKQFDVNKLPLRLID